MLTLFDYLMGHSQTSESIKSLYLSLEMILFCFDFSWCEKLGQRHYGETGIVSRNSVKGNLRHHASYLIQPCSVCCVMQTLIYTSTTHNYYARPPSYNMWWEPQDDSRLVFLLSSDSVSFIYFGIYKKMLATFVQNSEKQVFGIQQNMLTRFDCE